MIDSPLTKIVDAYRPLLSLGIDHAKAQSPEAEFHNSPSHAPKPVLRTAQSPEEWYAIAFVRQIGIEHAERLLGGDLSTEVQFVLYALKDSPKKTVPQLSRYAITGLGLVPKNAIFQIGIDFMTNSPIYCTEKEYRDIYCAKKNPIPKWQQPPNHDRDMITVHPDIVISRDFYTG